MFFLVTRGLHLSIEFTGGTVIEVAYAQPADIDKVRSTVEALGFGEVQVQNFGTSRDVLIRLPLRGDVKQSDVVARVFDELCKAEGGKVEQRESPATRASQVSRQACVAGDAEPVQLSRSEFVGPQVGEELADDGAKALAFVVHRHHDLPGVPLRVEVRGRRDRRQPARRDHHPRLLRLLPVGVLAVGAGGGAGGAGLFGQRVGGHLRPDPRDLPALPQDDARTR